MVVLMSVTIGAILAIILGIAVLVFPKILRWAVGLYLLVFGILQLVNQYVPTFSPY
jgi:ABC-type arginine/histidine transport system permease subunit